MICKLLERANTCPKLAWIWMFTNAFGYLVKTLFWQVIYNSILDAIPATQQLASWIVMLSSCYSLLLLRYQADATFHQKRYTCDKYFTFPAQETVCESPPFLLPFPFLCDFWVDALWNFSTSWITITSKVHPLINLKKFWPGVLTCIQHWLCILTDRPRCTQHVDSFHPHGPPRKRNTKGWNC